jgi:opine dehydrogenase
MKIAVLGGGNGSHAAAADLSELGHDVRWWRRDRAAVERLRASGSRLALKDHRGMRDVGIPLVTNDIAEAVREATLVVCPVPAFAQIDIAKILAPHLENGQVVFLPPGSFGSFVMAQVVKSSRPEVDATFAEAGTLPWLTRLHGPSVVAITTRATRLPTGVYPDRNRSHALAVIRAAFPSVEDAGDALSGALMNAGPIIHPPLIVMNAGPIEHFEKWDIHKEGTQPAIRRVTDQLDGERIRLREALGYGAPHFPLADHYSAGGDPWMYGNLAHEKLTSSGDWRERLVLTEHRYMLEDVAIGLSFLVSVARWGGVQAPVAGALLALGGAICGRDFMAEGRSLEALGLADLSQSALASLLRNGS